MGPHELLNKSIEPLLGLFAGIYLMPRNPLELRLAILVGGLFGWLPDLLVFLDWKYGVGMQSFLEPILKIGSKKD